MVDLFHAIRGMFKPLLTCRGRVSLILEEPVGIRGCTPTTPRFPQILKNFISNALKFTPGAKSGSRPTAKGETA